MKTILYILIFGASNLAVNNDCTEMLKAYNKQMRSMTMPKGKQVYYFNYTTEIDYWDESMPSQKVTTKMYIGENRTFYFSNAMDVFIDDEIMATVIKKERKIVFNANPKKTNYIKGYQQIYKIQDMVLDKGKVLKCATIKDGKSELILDAKNIEVEGLFIDQIKYIYESESGKLIEATSSYTDEYDIKKLRYQIHDLKFDGQYKGFTKVQKRFFNSKGDLLEKYKDYEIIVD